MMHSLQALSSEPFLPFLPSGCLVSASPAFMIEELVRDCWPFYYIFLALSLAAFMWFIEPVLPNETRAFGYFCWSLLLVAPAGGKMLVPPRTEVL